MTKTRDALYFKASTVGHKKQSNSSKKVSFEPKRPVEIDIDSRESEHVVCDSLFLINI